MVLGIVGAATSVIGGIFGASQQSSANRKAESAAKKQQEILEEQAEINNEYRQEAFKAEKKDYFAQREFEYDMAVRQYGYNQSIQDYRYLQDVRMYGKSVETTNDQLVYNSLASQQAYESTQSQFQELLQSQAFAKQNLYVESLENQGKAAVQQAGRGNLKGQQVTLAQQGMDLSVLRQELRSGERQVGRQMRDIGIQKYAADKNALANMMIEPERAPDALAPVMGPERTFIEPPEELPGAVPPPAYSSPLGPLIGGFGSAVSQLGQINWGGTQPSQTFNLNKSFW
jgi:hypothetical protein